ncbi:UNVERIFIED_CONTAM: Retrovirus-related Pol polyprotein from transposon [Sesamum indicum]
MKFPTPQGVEEVKCDQRIARQCYNLAVKQGELKKEKRKEELNRGEEAKRGKMERIEPSEEYKEVELISGNFQKLTCIGSQMTTEIETMMIDFLRSNSDLFAWSPSDFQGINPEIIVHRLNIDQQVKPVKQKKRVLGIERNKIIEEEVGKLLQAGFVREIQYTTWLLNVVIVPKAAGKWRMCTDYTDLNKACPKDPYPLPRIDLLVDSMAGCALFSMMDAYQGYHQIFMAKEDAEKTAFVTEKGVYCYNVMPFGLKNAGATYQRLVSRMFKDHIGSTMEVYVDDMLVKSKQEGDHLANLRTAFDIMRSYGMKLNPSKRTFGVRGGKFLGYMVSEWGIEANPRKNQSDHAAGIAKIDKRGATIDGKGRLAKSFHSQELKLYLTTPPLLSNPMVGEKFENGKQNPVYYVSKMLQGAEKKYIQIEKLALALVITTRKLQPYFQSHPIVVLTNHPLKQVMSKPDTSGRMIKWAVELGEFDIEFQTRNAIKAQVFADFLVEFEGEQPEKEERWLLHVDGSSTSKNGVAGIYLQGPDGVEIEIAVRLNFPATNNEAEYEALIQGLQITLDRGIRQVDVYTDSQLVAMQVQATYEMCEWSMTQYLARVKDMMKKSDRCTIIQIPRDENMRADALSRFGSLVEGIKERKITVMVKSKPIIDEAEVHVVETADSWKTPFVRYLKHGELPSDAITAKRLQLKANRFTMIGDDLYKRTPEGILLKCLDAERAQYVMKEIHEGSCGNHSGGRSLAQKIIRQGYFWPTIVEDSLENAKVARMGNRHRGSVSLGSGTEKISDCGGRVFFQFQGKRIVAWCKELKIQQNFTAVGNPQANGQAEVTNCTLLQYLKTRLKGVKGAWVEELPGVLWAYRTTPRTATGETLFCLVYGSEAIIPAEIGEETARVTQYTVEENSQERAFDLTMIEERRDRAYVKILRYKSIMTRNYNRRVRPRNFQVGDLVLKKVEVWKHVGKLDPT